MNDTLKILIKSHNASGRAHSLNHRLATDDSPQQCQVKPVNMF